MDDMNNRGSTDGRIERAKDAALGSHHGPPSTADEIGEAAGAISGTMFGAGIGAATGPVGALLGGIAGALGGWWAGRAVSEAAEALTESDDSHYRAHFQSRAKQPADRSYDDVKAAYYLGHIASQNPNFVTREFDEVEPELARGWQATAEQGQSWEAARSCAREGYVRGRDRTSKSTIADQLLPRRPDERRD